MVTTGDHDDRVVPAHSFKFGAALQEAQAECDQPTLIRIETNAGHGAGKPTYKIIQEQADKMAFTFYNLNAPVKYLSDCDNAEGWEPECEVKQLDTEG